MYFLSATLPKEEVSLEELKDYLSLEHKVYTKFPTRPDLGARELVDFLKQNGQTICESFRFTNFGVVPLVKKSASVTAKGIYIRGSVNSTVGPIVGLYLANINRDIKQLRTTIWHELFHAYCEQNDELTDLGEKETVVEEAAVDFDDVYIVRNSLELSELNQREQDGYVNVDEILKHVEFKHDFLMS